MTAIAKTVVEGLERSALVAFAKKNGREGDPKWGSISGYENRC